MAKLIDLTGKRFGLLTVIEREPNAAHGIAVWRCKCDCGQYTSVRGNNLKSGAVKSCGCLRHATAKNKTHGMSKTHLYRVWAGVKRRCYYKKDVAYKNYGGRGIKMCDEWRNSSEQFIKWAVASGYREGLTIERIDNDGDYCPNNCTWVPLNEQANNRRMCLQFEHDGRTLNLAQWCKELGLNYSRTHNRIYKLKWPFEKAISEPVDEKKRAGKKGD